MWQRYSRAWGGAGNYSNADILCGTSWNPQIKHTTLNNHSSIIMCKPATSRSAHCQNITITRAIASDVCGLKYQHILSLVPILHLKRLSVLFQSYHGNDLGSCHCSYPNQTDQSAFKEITTPALLITSLRTCWVNTRTHTHAPNHSLTACIECH